MTSHKQLSSNTLLVLTIASVLGLWYLLYPYAGVISLALLTAYLAFTVYHRFQSKKRHRWWLSLALTWLVIIFVVIVPLGLVWLFLGQEVQQIYTDITDSGVISQMIEKINPWIQKIPLADLSLDATSIQEQLIWPIQSILNRLGSFTLTITSGFISFTTAFILYVFVVSGVLTHSRVLVREIKALIPLEDAIISRYLHQIGVMSKGIVTSTFIIAGLQGIATAASFWVVGIPYFVFFMILTALMAIIPMLWAWVIATVAGVILIATGNIVAGIGVIVFNQVFVNNIDNILRPKLIPQEGQIDDTLLILSVFGWLYWWGIGGILYGPVMMSVILTTFTIFKDYLAKLPKK